VSTLKPPQAAEREKATMTKNAALFLRTPRKSGDPRTVLTEEAAQAISYANRVGLRIVQVWIAEEEPEDPNPDAFRRFAMLAREDPEVDVVLLGILEDAAMSPENLLALASLLLEDGLEIHSFLTGHSIEAPTCEEELLDLEERDNADDQE
jgi:hypothetical protein